MASSTVNQPDSDQPARARVAVITGAGTGVGRAAAVALDGDGWSTVLVGRRPDPLAETAARLSGESLTVVADVADEVDVDRVFSTTVERFGRVDLLFNNAGTGAPPVPFDELTLDQWQTVVDVNLTGSFLCARAAFARMRTQIPSGGRIINNGSISATTPRPNSAPYTATKHAITGLTKSIALDGRSLGITCGQIDIGNAATPMTTRMSEGIVQPDGSVRVEATMDAVDVGRAVAHMAALPADTNILTMTIMANEMPYIGRG